MRALLLAAFVLLLAAAADAQEKRKFDKSKHPWVRFKVGSWVSFKVTVSPPPPDQVARELKWELKNSGEGKYVIKETQNFMGSEKTETKMSALPTYVKSETVKIGTEEHVCHVWKSVEMGDKGRKTEALLWVDDKHRLIKMKSEGAEAIEAEAEGLDVEIEAGGKKLTASKLSGTIKKPLAGIKGKVTLWATDQIPGGTAKMVIEGDIQAIKMTMTLEVSKFEAKE